MRRRIRSRVLRERFQRAWSILPASERNRLRAFIRYVDETDVLEGTLIYARPEPGGAVELIAELGRGAGFAAFLSLATGDVADVVLPADPLTAWRESPAVAVILHELAHVADHLDRPKEASERARDRSERYAWAQALAWAHASSLSDRESGELAANILSLMRDDAIRRLLQ